jgi:hypothetical protein
VKAEHIVGMSTMAINILPPTPFVATRSVAPRKEDVSLTTVAPMANLPNHRHNHHNSISRELMKAMATAASSAPVSTLPNETETITIMIGVRGLSKKDVMSASDPLVRVSMKGSVIGQTEWVKDKIDYDWSDPISLSSIPCNGSITQPNTTIITFSVYDMDNGVSEPRSEDLIGSVNVTIDQLLSEPIFALPLLDLANQVCHYAPSLQHTYATLNQIKP